MSRKFFQWSLILILFNPLILLGQEPVFPYTLKKSDYILAGVGFSTLLYGEYLQNRHPVFTLENLNALNRNDINSFDRTVTYQWNQDIHRVSDVTRSLLVASPALLFVSHEIHSNWMNIMTYSVMYAEVMLVTGGLTHLTKSVVMRKRPFVYNTDISRVELEELIATTDVYDSFFSGHTSFSFASAVFLSKTYTDLYGQNTPSRVIWGSSLTLASVSGYLRYKSGRHFPTDIIAGALVGSAVGYFIPILHKKESRLKNLSLAVNGYYFSVSYSF